MHDIMTLLLAADFRGYISEPISQLEHALQAAYFATRSLASDEEIAAALLHDIGHLVGDEVMDNNEPIGVKDHEIIGANFLRAHGAPAVVCELVASHVKAKRYLVYKNALYRDKLSPASLATFRHQGGPMNAEEAKVFECDPLFRAKIALRTYDERAKELDLNVPPLSSYEPLLQKIFKR